MSPRDEEFSDFVRRHGPGLLRLARLLKAGDSHAAEDLLQAALIRTYVSWHKINEPAARVAYVRTTMTRILMRERRAPRVGALDMSEDIAAEQPRVELLVASRVDLWHYLRQLPARQRAVVVLRYFLDLSEKEIAEAMNCAPGTVKSHGARALRALREAMPDDYRERKAV